MVAHLRRKRCAGVCGSAQGNGATRTDLKHKTSIVFALPAQRARTCMLRLSWTSAHLPLGMGQPGLVGRDFCCPQDTRSWTRLILCPLGACSCSSFRTPCPRSRRRPKVPSSVGRLSRSPPQATWRSASSLEVRREAGSSPVGHGVEPKCLQVRYWPSVTCRLFDA